MGEGAEGGERETELLYMSIIYIYTGVVIPYRLVDLKDSSSLPSFFLFRIGKLAHPLNPSTGYKSRGLTITRLGPMEVVSICKPIVGLQEYHQFTRELCLPGFEP